MTQHRDELLAQPRRLAFVGQRRFAILQALAGMQVKGDELGE